MSDGFGVVRSFHPSVKSCGAIVAGGTTSVLVVSVTWKSAAFPGMLRVRNCSGGEGRAAMIAS